MPQTVSITFFRFDSPATRFWALWMMGAGKRPISRIPDIGFWKLCGSGKGEGFNPTIAPTVFAILATWPDADTARARTANAPIFGRYRAKAAEDWTVFLSPVTSRGHWSGTTPFQPTGTDLPGPLAAITRATIRPGILRRFWSRVPNISAIIGADTQVAFKIGIGELPLIQQVTFSIWPSKSAMDAFARTGHHAAAIRAVRDEGWFREELYARFAVLSDSGTWNGTSPLKRLEAA